MSKSPFPGFLGQRLSPRREEQQGLFLRHLGALISVDNGGIRVHICV